VGLLQEGRGIVWNVSMNGWRLSGDVPLTLGKTYPLYVHVPNQLSLVVAGAIVRWNRGQEYGLETLVVDRQTQSRVAQIVQHLEQLALESIE
jgi:hypothetical protein